MKRSVVLAIVISLVVAAIGIHGFHWFLPESRHVLFIASALIAVAGGLIALAILRLLAKPPALLPNVGVQIVATAVLSGLFLFAAAHLAPTKGHTAVVSCSPVFFNSREEDPNRNGLNPGEQLTWMVRGNAGTKVVFTPVIKDGCLAEWPFSDGPSEIPIDSSGMAIHTGRPVPVAKNGCFSYEIDCGNGKKIDPIIDVPPKPHYLQ